jgi:hypothetical protein
MAERECDESLIAMLVHLSRERFVQCIDRCAKIVQSMISGKPHSFFISFGGD